MNKENTFNDSFTLRNTDFSDKHRQILLNACDRHAEIFVE